jgi:hypothetical protein
MIERRYARAAVDLPARYSIEGRPGWHTSMIDDLGGGGARLQTQEDVSAGTVLSLNFDIEGTPITVTARIAMSLFDKARARFVHGVAFTAIDPRHQATIVALVMARSADEGR